MTASRPTKPQRWISLAASPFAAGLLFMIVGCGGPRPCVVTGKVLVDNAPAEGVYVIFHTVGGSTERPDSGSSRTVDDGSYSLVVSMPGDSVVTAFWPKVTVNDVETTEGPDLFGGLYRDPQQPVAKVTIREGENDIPPISLTRLKPGKSNVRGHR
jgi:hypothetical protein